MAGGGGRRDGVGLLRAVVPPRWKLNHHADLTRGVAGVVGHTWRARSPIVGVGCVAPGTWRRVRGAGYVASGAWRRVRGVGCVAPGTCRRVREVEYSRRARDPTRHG